MGFQMFRFLALLTSVLIVFGLISQVLSRNHGYYTIVAPGTIRSKSIFHLSISLSDFHQSCWLNISLQDGHQEPLNLETIEIQPKTTKLVELQAPYLIEKVGKLIVIGYRGIIKTEFANINFEHDSYSAFIQTNKAKYKPGKLVEFRVIFINQLTRPAQIDDVIIVMIYDGQENLIKQIVNVKLVQGVFKGEFQLSKLPVLGEWKIKVEVGGDLAAEKSLDVARYVPPKFLVKINTKSNVAVNEERISLEISASYFYGEPVKGKLNIHVNNTYAASHDKLPVFEKELAIDGKTTIDLDMKNDLQMQIGNKDHYSKKLYEFFIKAFMIDDLSKLKAWTSAEIAIHNQPYKIILQAPRVFDSSEHFRLMVSRY
ncbi:ovostatin-like [Episyrphus balteatus]|uniref:ovostatin-like n=1 Tax=Episyrphus balteatus TaxID=286459 RepID=UPI0024856587|nr:ovostatin-like [Episyrphus balteatus]